MNAKILGTGCAKCDLLLQRVNKVAADNGIDIEIDKVTDVNDILSYGIMMTPGLVVNGEVKSSGHIPGEEEILAWIRD